MKKYLIQKLNLQKNMDLSKFPEVYTYSSDRSMIPKLIILAFWKIFEFESVLVTTPTQAKKKNLIKNDKNNFNLRIYFILSFGL